MGVIGIEVVRCVYSVYEDKYGEKDKEIIIRECFWFWYGYLCLCFCLWLFYFRFKIGFGIVVVVFVVVGVVKLY